jgi:DNA-binding response OmpR family regulator
MREYLRRILHHEYGILAMNGVEAFEQAQAARPDLILTDVMMPRMGGPDLLKAVRNNQALAKTAVVLLTARGGVEARIESLESEADDYLANPFEDNELLARIRNLIRMKAQDRIKRVREPCG